MEQESELEKIISEAINRMEAGEKQADIFVRFPEHKKELSEMFQTIGRFSLLGKDIKPDRALLEKIMREAGAVTRAPESRFSYARDKTKGRWLFVNPFQIQRIMNTQMKVLFPLAAIILLVGSVYYFNQAGSPEFAAKTADEAPLSQGMPAAGDSSVREMAATTQAPSTGNPDEIVDDIIASLANEEAILNDANADADFATYDSAVLGEFGQFSYE